MHNFFTLVGDKWAKSGSIFCPKDLERHFPMVTRPNNPCVFAYFGPLSRGIGTTFRVFWVPFSCRVGRWIRVAN